MKALLLVGMLLAQAPDAPLADAPVDTSVPDTLCFTREDAVDLDAYVSRLEGESGSFKQSIEEAKHEWIKWMLIGTGIGAAVAAA